jgi:hypothetical protein
METLGHSQISLTLDTYSRAAKSSSRGREANGGGSWREWLSNRAERRDSPARIAKFRRASREPKFRELEPDLGLAAPARGTSQSRLTKAGGADVISRLEQARGVPLRLRGGSAPDLQRSVLMFEIIC